MGSRLVGGGAWKVLSLKKTHLVLGVGGVGSYVPQILRRVQKGCSLPPQLSPPGCQQGHWRLPQPLLHPTFLLPSLPLLLTLASPAPSPAWPFHNSQPQAQHVSLANGDTCPVSGENWVLGQALPPPAM